MKLFDFNHDGNTDFYEEMMGLHIISSSLSEAEGAGDLEDALMDDGLGMDDEAEGFEDEADDDEEYDENCDDEEYEDFDDLEGDYDDVSDLF